MYRHRDLSVVPAAYRGAAAAMGNFDGIHRGHRAVIDRAAAADAPLGIVTFEPHPRSYFAPESPPFRLMTADTRARRLDTLGVEMLYELPFTAALAGLEAEVFVQDVLAARLGLSHLVVGADFRFGRGRRGDAAMLVDLGAAAGITVEITPLVEDDAVAVSSSAIRAALAEGRPGDAAAMLGDWHRIEGRVEHGEKRGRALGYPTANLALSGLHLPRFGVYAVIFDVRDGPHKGRYGGAASLGVRPMFGVNAPNFETFVLDFEGDLYGADVSVALIAFLRGEVAFDGVDALIRQMSDDTLHCREILASYL